MRSDLRSDLRSLPRSWPIRLALSWTTLWPICNLYNFPTIMFSGGQILSDESVNFVAKFRHMCMHKIRGNVRDICSLNFYGFNVFACCASGNACIAWLGVCMAFDRRTYFYGIVVLLLTQNMFLLMAFYMFRLYHTQRSINVPHCLTPVPAIEMESHWKWCHHLL